MSPSTLPDLAVLGDLPPEETAGLSPGEAQARQLAARKKLPPVVKQWNAMIMKLNTDLPLQVQAAQGAADTYLTVLGAKV